MATPPFAAELRSRAVAIAAARAIVPLAAVEYGGLGVGIPTEFERCHRMAQIGGAVGAKARVDRNHAGATRTFDLGTDAENRGAGRAGRGLLCGYRRGSRTCGCVRAESTGGYRARGLSGRTGRCLDISVRRCRRRIAER